MNAIPESQVVVVLAEDRSASLLDSLYGRFRRPGREDMNGSLQLVRALQ